jgi:hypothetical protein
MRGRIIVLVALLGLVAVSSAQADSRKVKDPRGDTKGSHWPGPGFVWATSGPCTGSWMSTATGSCAEADYFENAGPLLDITSVSHGHRRTSVVHRLSTARAWKSSIFSATRGGQASFYFDTDGDAAFERRIDVYFQRGKLRAVLRNASGRTVARIAATHPDRRTVEVSFRRSLLPGAHIEWFAFAGIQCKRKFNACGDRSPGNRMIGHHLG